MHPRMPHPFPLRRLRACRKGSTAVEFALLAPLVVVVMMAIVEFALISFAGVVMDGVSASVSHIGKTGYAPAGTDRLAYLRNQLQVQSGGLLNPSLLSIDIQWYNGLNDVGKPEPCLISACSPASPPGTYTDVNGNRQWDADQGSPGAGSGGVAALYRLSYPWPLFTPAIRAFFGGAGTVTLSSSAVVRNEGF